MKKLLLVIGLMTGILAVANAQTGKVVRAKQQNQISRIHQGVNNGELTRTEAKRLKAEQKHINKEKKCAAADGVITRRERQHIRRDQRRASRDIRHQKHDLQKRN